MVLPFVTVRALSSRSERALHFQQADQEFSLVPSVDSASRWESFVTNLPEYRLETIRGAFRGGEQVGSYVLYERTLRVGAAQLPSGCIAALVTYSSYRGQGIAALLMQDAIDYALAHSYALLLLDGIPKFYYRYGYTDVFDLSIQEIDRASILAQVPTAHKVNPATENDAKCILELYERHFRPYTGSFSRTLAQQIHRIRYRASNNPLLLAIDSAGSSHGYLALQGETDPSLAQELAADNWSAALALLQYHARLVEGSSTSAILQYRLPSTSLAILWMIDHLKVPGIPRWYNTTEGWTVRQQTYCCQDAGWMARLVHLPTLMRRMLPEWQARWKRSLSRWIGDISLNIEGEIYTFHIDNTNIKLIDLPADAIDTLYITPQAFITMVFGYRSVMWVLDKTEQSFRSDLRSVLCILFPEGYTWIPSSDWF